jgi:acyl-CoA synthetase (AMP-forming)/AMP-acid ligase II
MTRTIAGFATVHAAFAAAARDHADAPFMQVLPETANAYGIEAGELTYGDAHGRITRLVDRYRRAGYGLGHRVGLLLENRPAFMLHWLALNALGASVVPINAEMRAAELDYLVEHSGLCLAVVLEPRRADLEAAAARMNCTVVVVGPGEDAPLPAAPFAAPGAGEPALETESGLLYTSGTTGRPKGCVLSNAYYLLSGERYRQLGGRVALQTGDRLITPLPLVHMNAMAVSTSWR